jgi:4-hydroxy-tetrahydrodipicolinate synthase
MISGSIVALVTPMTTKQEVDTKTFCDLIEFHIANGTNAIVIGGTTGEGATLSNNELLELTKLALQVANKRIPIIAGTGTNCTKTTIAKTQAAAELGVAACLVVTPYYNRPTQEGLYLHYQALVENVKIPIILYNVPGRTGCDLLPETAVRLSYLPHVLAIKDATGKLERLKFMQENCKRGFKFYSGDDPTCLEFMLMGGHGVISITSNVVPQLMSRMCAAAMQQQDHHEAQKIDKTLAELHRLLVIESNPIPVKWALSSMKLIGSDGTLRLPLTQLSKENQDRLQQVLGRLQLAG